MEEFLPFIFDSQSGAQCLSQTSGQDAPMADAQRLSRLWRTHSVFRAYGGHTVPFAPTAGTQCLPRLWRTHSVFRAYGGHIVPSAPMAGTQCLSRLRRSPRRQGKNFLTGGLHSASDLKKKSTEYRKEPSLGKTPGLGPRCLSGRRLPFYF